MIDKLNNDFIERLKVIYNTAEYTILEDGFKITKRKTSFRVNILKATDEEVIKELKDRGLKVKKMDFLKHGYILLTGKEKDLWDLDIFKDGKIYLQSISSQLPVDLLELNAGDKVLDVTAAPGGKTSQVCAVLCNNGEIVANDNNSIRIDKLRFTLNRQGCENVKVIKSDARNIGNNRDFIEYFDSIIADLPCSAEGKINLNKEKTYGFWNECVIKKNYKLQKDIIKSIIPLLKKGGTLVYSTCTLAPEENEAVVHMILSNYPELYIQDLNLGGKYFKPGILKFGKQVFRKDVAKSIRVLPSEETEGFFIAKFIKNNTGHTNYFM